MEIADPLQVAAFENRLRCRVLVTCGPAERSLSELQRLLAMPLPKLHYHVRRLLDAGLLTVSRAQPRAGRPVQFYRAVAERFLVPLDASPALPGDGLAAELRQLLSDELGRGGAMATLYEPGPAEGTMLMRLIRPEPEPSRGFEFWRTLHLTPAQRAALAKELAATFERYATGEPAVGAEPYLAHAAFAPRAGGPG
jgi:DNA-binding transcriptional ArsR family regulator